jgi:hypothetical protein
MAELGPSPGLLGKKKSLSMETDVSLELPDPVYLVPAWNWSQGRRKQSLDTEI